MCSSCVSIIVPIYKVEEYLPECIDSLVNQTYKNIEIILVDDGSPDGCPQICDDYAQKDKRIKVLHKKNGGLSDARNKGLDICSGEYIMFVDSDDIIHKEMVERLVLTLKKKKVEIVECSVIKFSHSIVFQKYVEKQIDVYNKIDALRELILDNIFHQTVWNKIYTKDVIGDNIFPVGKCNEDEFWTYRVFANANKVAFLSDSLYFYRQRETSIIHNQYSIKRLDALEAKVIRLRFIEIYFPVIKDIAKYNLLMSCLYAGQMVIQDMDKKDQKVAWSIILKIHRDIAIKDDILKNDEIPMKQRIWCLISKMSLRITCRIRNRLKIGL